MGSMDELNNFFKNKRILVTGHTGFKGSWLTKILSGAGAKISGISLAPETDPNLFRALDLEKVVEHNIFDISDFKKVLGVFEKFRPEIVFHLAAQPIVRLSYDRPHETILTNVMGTTNILEASRLTGFPKSIVVITTDKVYENKESGQLYKEDDPLGGHDPYSSSKAAADILSGSYAKSFGLPLAVARAGNVIGGGDWAKDRIIPDMVRAVYVEKKKLAVRNPKAIRPWQHVLEPLYGYLLLAESLYNKKKVDGHAWNFGPGEESFVPVDEMLERSKKVLTGLDYDVIPEPGKHEAGVLKLSSVKAEGLGWRPKMGLEETIRLTAEWYKGFYEGGDSRKITEEQIKIFFN